MQDGYTKEVGGQEAVQVLVLNVHHNRSGRFNFTTQFPYYREILYKPKVANGTRRGRAVVLDMDMSAGDFLALICLLKAPVEVVDLKVEGILVSGNGWATAATIDIIYDVLHMMGRDDVPVGLGNLTALGTPSLGCKYVKAIPQGSGGLVDSDTLYGLGRTLPRSPRSYAVENSVRFGGAQGNTDRPKLRQALATEVWESISRAMQAGEKKLTVLTNGPLTNLANIIDGDKSAADVIQDVYIVGGQVIDGKNKTGNVFTVPSNKFAEFNMFLDPLAAKKVMESNLRITLIPLSAQQKVSSFKRTLQNLKLPEMTPESIFAHRLLSLLYKLQQKQPKLYRHMVKKIFLTGIPLVIFVSHPKAHLLFVPSFSLCCLLQEIFLGEVLGAVFLVEHSKLNPTVQTKKVTVLTGNVSLDGQITVDKSYGKLVNIVDEFDSEAYYKLLADLLLGYKQQSAAIGSFDEQRKIWSTPPK
ncbi:hypothetical protein GW17_00049035 [Ensete ventricosum]|nr:hypothetical protein GW17_00049035 [Ensete ventricosum]